MDYQIKPKPQVLQELIEPENRIPDVESKETTDKKKKETLQEIVDA